MRATTWQGKWAVDMQRVPDPVIVNPGDLVMRVTHTAICGSDIHLYNGVVPGMRRGDILGHEPVGEVMEIGPGVTRHRVGDRIAVAPVIACGRCEYCRRDEFSLCDNTNPNARMQEKLHTYATAGVFGFTHLHGGYPGAQAEYLRVPFADVGAFTIPDEVTSEQAVCITDSFPTGYMGADLCDLEGGETVAVWGAGPVGLFAMQSAWLMGAARVIAIDRVPARLRMARERCLAETLDFGCTDVSETLREMTGGRGPDCCIDACGMEAHGTNPVLEAYDAVRQALRPDQDRGHVLREMVSACRKGGRIAVMGAQATFVDRFPIGMAFAKGLSFRMGQQHGPKYIPTLFELTREGRVDPAFCVTHR
ncbi:MAG TPA: zinc-dependent alcohol dehydrogenase, partial [Gemmatimonadales bacterium]|nr:zinc-dependent alcohol dehydrogenase [Gemmatimonadales bacterium]